MCSIYRELVELGCLEVGIHQVRNHIAAEPDGHMEAALYATSMLLVETRSLFGL